MIPEQEHDTVALFSGNFEQLSQVLSPLGDAVVLANLDLVQGVHRHVGGQSGGT